MTIETGGPYHPSKQDDQPGATLRDEIALRILPIILTRWSPEEMSKLQMAKVAYDYADAMLTVRNKQEGAI